MKNSITSFVASGLVSCALAIGASTASFAQSGAVAKADIPFAFQVGSTIMPAGTYTFSRDGGNIMLLNGSKPHSQALSLVRAETGLKAPKVGTITFNKYGDRYFLHKVSTSDSATAYECPTSKQEKALIRELNWEKANQVAVNVMPNLH
jgi:hypothetical protein